MDPDPVAVAEGTPGGLIMVPRATFLTQYWDYRPGEHVTMVAPTGYGKSWWKNDLLAATATPDLPAVVLATKPRDATMDRLLRRTDLRRVTTWPPRDLGQVVTSQSQSKPPGWVVWPIFTGDPRRDDAEHVRIFRRALMHPYSRNAKTRKNLVGRPAARQRALKPMIIDVDEIYGVAIEMSLRREMITLWSKGRSVGIGLWGGTQRPFDVPQHAYSQPQHLFLGYTPDRRDRQRFREIGGVNPDLVMAVTERLAWRQWLYIHREQQAMCVIEAN